MRRLQGGSAVLTALDRAVVRRRERRRPPLPASPVTTQRLGQTDSSGPTGPDGVTVVIPHYGDPRLAARAAADVLAADAPTQVVVVDDASPVSFASADDRITVIRRTTNGGFGAAVNTGAERARMPWLLILNSDVRMAPDALPHLLEAARGLEPSICSPVIMEDARPTPTTNRFLAPHQAFGALQALAAHHDRPAVRALIGFDDPPPGAQPQVTDWLVGACLLVRTAAFHECGGFDEDFHMYCEEIDLQRRLRERGVRAVLVRSVRVEHAGGGTTGSLGRADALARSQLRYAAKWGFRNRLAAAWLAVALGNLAYNTARWAAGRDVTPGASARREIETLLSAWRSTR